MAKNFLVRLGYSKRRASTKAAVNPDDFEKLKAQFGFDVRAIMEL